MKLIARRGVPPASSLLCRPAPAAVKNAAGAPWACSVSPFVDAGAVPGDDGQQGSPPPVPIDRVARCEECFAYISPFSEFTTRCVPCFIPCSAPRCAACSRRILRVML